MPASTITPTKKPTGKKSAGSSANSSATKLKQSSLFSFFSKSKSSPTQSNGSIKTGSSPSQTSSITKSRTNTDPSSDLISPVNSSPLKKESTKFTNNKKSSTTSTISQKKAAQVPIKKIDIDDDSEDDVPLEDRSLNSIKNVVTTPVSMKKLNRPIRESDPFNSSPDKFSENKENVDINQTQTIGSKDPVPSSPIKSRHKKKINYNEDSDDDDDDEESGIVASSKKTSKRRKLTRVLDDDDDDFVDDAGSLNESEDDLKDAAAAESEDEPFGDDDDEDLLELKKVSNAKKSNQAKTASSVSSSLANKFKASSNYVANKSTPKKSTPIKSDSFGSAGKSSPFGKKNFTKENEERYQWLENIRDADGKDQSDPEYDPRTLYIPKAAWKKFTPFETQYWEIKSKMWDSVVFFKKGKFYELYENDADIAHQKYELKLAGGGRANMRLAGIPEMSFDYWAKRFIDDGYKVAKVDQKESMLAKEIREKGGNGNKKEEKVIKRELSCVLTCGTLTDETMLTDEMARYCLTAKEVTNSDGTKIFGVAFVDTATGSLQITQFDDDSECSKFETLLAQVKPMEVLVEKSHITPLAMKILRFNSQPSAIFSFLKTETEFWDNEVTFEELTRGKYFEAEDLDDLSHYPKILIDYHENDKAIGFSAFGALLYYLKTLKLDQSIISMGNITHYDPYKSNFANSTMRLDGVTLQNLEIFSNSFDSSDKGTLFKLLNRAITAFGKRMFRSWVVHPLMSKSKIDGRLDSVEHLMNDGDLKYLFESKLNKLPDLERLLARVHSGTLKVKDFDKVVEGFETVSKLISQLKETYGENHEQLSGALKEIVNGVPSELEECIKKWSNAFDRGMAASEGILIPERGVELEFDESNDNIKRLEKDLESQIRTYRREFKSQEICYKDSGKEIYLIEVPMKVTSKIPKSWQQMAATAKCKRYWSPEGKVLVRELMEARELHKILGETIQQKMYAKFDSDSKVWSTVVRKLAEIDCIISLTRSSESLGYPMCRPEFVEESESPFIDFKELRHPCFIPGGVSGTKDFIPNDVSLGVEDKNQVALLTGANAAGKSTLLRMTCVAVIMAQIGCFIPASSAKLTTIDSIMTRLGANDNIMQGKSTFFVELSETKRMLESATPRSLLVLDELGRGGSSSDGFAIAESVLHHIATHVQSLGFFATHYGTLGSSFVSHPRVRPLRMGILIDEGSKNITFLYKLEEGKSNGSFGMHVASMCGVPEKIVKRAEIAAENWEHTSKLKKKSKGHEELTNIIPLGLQSDISWLVKENNDIGCGDGCAVYTESMKLNSLKSIMSMIEGL
ncbi:hypothetical protein B5S31_g3677 [[Candida] boidinii]|nr:hypothetical protein B5S31_g3677 [[Candida] boidinii]